MCVAAQLNTQPECVYELVRTNEAATLLEQQQKKKDRIHVHVFTSFTQQSSRNYSDHVVV